MPAAEPALDAESTALLEIDRFAIEVVTVKAYLWGGYRYSSARDAVAAAKRSFQS